MTARSPLRRRSFLSLSAALLGSSAVTARAFAQQQAAPANANPPPANAAAPAAPPATPGPVQFSFDILSQQMQDKAKKDFVPAEIPLPSTARRVMLCFMTFPQLNVPGMPGHRCQHISLS